MTLSDEEVGRIIEGIIASFARHNLEVQRQELLNGNDTGFRSPLSLNGTAIRHVLRGGIVEGSR